MKPEFPAAPRAPLCPHAFIRSGRCSNKTFGGGGVGLFVCLFLRRGRRFLLGTQAAVKTCAKNKRKIILFKVAERGGRKPRRGPRFGGDLKAVYSASLAKLLHVTVLRGGTGTPPLPPPSLPVVLLGRGAVLGGEQLGAAGSEAARRRAPCPAPCTAGVIGAGWFGCVGGLIGCRTAARCPAPQPGSVLPAPHCV